MLERQLTTLCEAIAYLCSGEVTLLVGWADPQDGGQVTSLTYVIQIRLRPLS